MKANFGCTVFHKFKYAKDTTDALVQVLNYILSEFPMGVDKSTVFTWY